MPTDQRRHQFVLPEQIVAGIDLRSKPIAGGRNRSETLSSCLTDFFALMEIGEGELKKISLTLPERNFLRAILNGTFLDVIALMNLHHEVLDADPDDAEYWGVNQADLAKRLETLSPAGKFAIADDIRKFWAATK